MSIKEQRRQKKLAKKRSKEVIRRKQQARERNTLSSIAGQIKAASTGAVADCMISRGILDPAQKLGTVVICRRMSDGRFAYVRFLIDGMCLGVKDVDAGTCFPGAFKELMEQARRAESFQTATPAQARKLVESAIAYAEQFQLHPPADYRKVAAIWNGIDASECAEEFHFGGKDGKPHYSNGPHDSPLFQSRVIETLNRAVGQGNYDFTFFSSSNPLGDDGYFDEFVALDDPELDADIDEDVGDDYLIER